MGISGLATLDLHCMHAHVRYIYTHVQYTVLSRVTINRWAKPYNYYYIITCNQYNMIHDH